VAGYQHQPTTKPLRRKRRGIKPEEIEITKSNRRRRFPAWLAAVCGMDTHLFRVLPANPYAVRLSAVVFLAGVKVWLGEATNQVSLSFLREATRSLPLSDAKGISSARKHFFSENYCRLRHQP